MVKDPSLFTPADWQKHISEAASLERSIDSAYEGLVDAFSRIAEQTNDFRMEMVFALGPEYLVLTGTDTRKCLVEPSIQTDILTSFRITMQDGSRPARMPGELVSKVTLLNDRLRGQFDTFQTDIGRLYELHTKAVSNLHDLTFAESIHTRHSDGTVIYYHDPLTWLMMRATINLETGQRELLERTDYPAQPTDLDKKAMAQDVRHKEMSAYLAWHTSSKVDGNKAFEMSRTHLVREYRQAHEIFGPVVLEKDTPEKGTLAVYEWQPTQADKIAYELMLMGNKKGDA